MRAGLLEKLRAMPAVVERKLGDAISVPVYASHMASLRGGAKDAMKDRGLYPGARPPFNDPFLLFLTLCACPSTPTTRRTPAAAPRTP